MRRGDLQVIKGLPLVDRIDNSESLPLGAKAWLSRSLPFPWLVLWPSLLHEAALRG